MYWGWTHARTCSTEHLYRCGFATRLRQMVFHYLCRKFQLARVSIQTHTWCQVVPFIILQHEIYMRCILATSKSIEFRGKKSKIIPTWKVHVHWLTRTPTNHPLVLSPSEFTATYTKHPHNQPLKYMQLIAVSCQPPNIATPLSRFITHPQHISKKLIGKCVHRRVHIVVGIRSASAQVVREHRMYLADVQRTAATLWRDSQCPAPFTQTCHSCCTSPMMFYVYTHCAYQCNCSATRLLSLWWLWAENAGRFLCCGVRLWVFVWDATRERVGWFVSSMSVGPWVFHQKRARFAFIRGLV